MNNRGPKYFGVKIEILSRTQLIEMYRSTDKKPEELADTRISTIKSMSTSIAKFNLYLIYRKTNRYWPQNDFLFV